VIVQTANRIHFSERVRAVKAVVGKKIRRAQKACEGSPPSGRTMFCFIQLQHTVGHTYLPRWWYRPRSFCFRQSVAESSPGNTYN
jgi:hypothetical protein